jgi:hypothetical protein
MTFLVLLAPFVAAAVALAVKDRVTAILVFLCYLSIEGLLKLLSGYHPIVHIGADIVLWTLVAVWAAAAVLQGRPRLPHVPFFVLVVLHVVWVALLVFSPYTPSLFAGAASLKIHLSMIPLYIIGFGLAAEPDAPRRVMRTLCIFWCGAFLLTILQYMSGPNSLLDFGGVYMSRLVGFHEWRPFGTTAVPGGEAIFALMALPFALCLVLRGDYQLRDPWILLTIVGSIAVFFISGVRQLFLGCLIILLNTVALQIARGRGRAGLLLVALVVLGTATYVGVQEYVLPQAQASLSNVAETPEIWKERSSVDRFRTLLDIETYRRARAGGLTLIWDRVTAFPFGAGLGRTGSAAAFLRGELRQDPLNAMIQDRVGFQDNFFAAMLVETGIPGTLLLTVILLGLTAMAIQLARHNASREDSAFGAMVSGYLLAVLVMSWGSQPLMSNPTLAFFWFLGGMVAGRARVSDE